VSTKGIIIRAATKSDYPAIASLLDKTFGDIPYEKRLRLWEWRHNLNPASRPDTPPFLVAEKNNEIVGVHGLTPLRMQIRSEEIAATCSCDLAVDEKARSAGMKLKLRALDREISPLHISTSANEPAYKITMALGGKPLNAGRKKYIKLLKISAYLKRLVVGKLGGAGKILALPASAIIGKPLDWIIQSGIKKKPGKHNSKYELRIINKFDERFDDFWKGYSEGWNVAVVRDSKYLNWRYIQYPFKGIIPLGLFEGDKVLAFGVIHNVNIENLPPFSVILELFSQDRNEDYALTLLRAMLSEAIAAGSHDITAMTPESYLERIFKKQSFHPRMAQLSPYTYKNNSAMTDDQIEIENKWLFSMGDGDICYFFD
jgi:N-acetylglutamate synthase-like GNAT family acetyltransferase